MPEVPKTTPAPIPVKPEDLTPKIKEEIELKDQQTAQDYRRGETPPKPASSEPRPITAEELAQARADLARRAQKPPTTPGERARLDIEGWEDVGYTDVYVDSEGRAHGTPPKDPTK